jgi:hypothetical protein
MMDTIVDFILDIMEAETARKIIRVVRGVLVLIVCVWLIVFIYGRLSAHNALRGWEETTATVMDSRITGERMELASRYLGSGASVGANSVGDRDYKIYTVSYAFTAECSAWGDPFVFEQFGSNTGEADVYAVEPPTYAYYIPQKGDAVNIVYDPVNEGSYKLGALSDWRAGNTLSLSDLYAPGICLILYFSLLTLDVKIKRRGMAS